MENQTDKKEFSVEKRIKSFSHAGRGMRVFFRTTHNAWIHIFIFIIVILMGVYFNITDVEWIAVIFASGLVLVAEAFNTAIEIDMDLTSPQFHPYAKDTKDVAAGAVLISVITASIIGIIIFGPHMANIIRIIVN